jgi:predicted nucleic-acid-binding Zn-ribbon protein
MFGSTRCGKCENSSFKVQEISPAGARYKMFTVQCSSCQTAIGVTDFFNLGSLLQDQEKKLKEMDGRLAGIEHSVHQIVQALNGMRR